MKSTIATTYIQVNLECPHCNRYQDRFEELREYFENGEPRAEDIDAQIRCIDCDQLFIVNSIQF